MKLKFKDRIKIFFFPVLATILNKIGFSWERLGKTVLNKSVLLAQAKSLSNSSITNKGNSNDYYFLTMLSGAHFMLSIESLLALSLKYKGHNVTILIDDNVLPIHELKKINNEENWNYQTNRDYIYASQFLKKLKLNFIPLSDFIKDADELIYDEKYNTILEATLLKQYKVGVISSDLPRLQEKTDLVKRAIAITDYIGKKLVKIGPNAVIMSHGIYSTWGPPFQVLDTNGIRILMYGRGKKRHTLKFDWNKTGDSWDVSQEWERVKNKELTKKELEEINTYLDSRISHKDDVFVYNFGKETTKRETIAFLGLDSDKPIYTLFTNVLWDAASAQREIAFKNPVEWVIETIQWFNEHPEKQLIVKIHPAEVVIGTNMPFYDIIINRIKPKENIRIIKPDEKVNSWSIYDISELGMVHTTTAGMELPLVYKPCIVVSKTHYRGKGFTLDINSKKEYFNLLENFNRSNVDYENNKREALKYAYLLFIRYQIPFNMFYEEISTDVKGFRSTTIDDFFKDKIFKSIIEKIEKNEPIFLND